METVARVLVLYVFLLLVLRFSGKRTLSEMTPFDFVLLLVISETTQNALVNEDYSVTNALLLITAFVVADVGLSLLKQASPTIAAFIEGNPLVIVDHGRLLEERMNKSRVDKEDILEAARDKQGLERIDQIKYAVLERHGEITVIPFERESRS